MDSEKSKKEATTVFFGIVEEGLLLLEPNPDKGLMLDQFWREVQNRVEDHIEKVSVSHEVAKELRFLVLQEKAVRYTLQQTLAPERYILGQTSEKK